MTHSAVPENAMGLADFLSDLRAELEKASDQAKGESLKLGVEEVTLSLDVAMTVARKGGGEVTATAKFWVFASAEAKLAAEASRERMTTHHLTLTLKPRREVDGETRGVDVEGGLAVDEENPMRPGPNDPASQ